MTAKKSVVAETTYIITHDNGVRRKITVPSSWKVTFGPAAAGTNKPYPNERLKMPMALRFYESKDNQRAIFTDVVSFRDSSIKIEEERTNTQQKHGFIEVDGARKATSFTAETKEWVNPDSVVDDGSRCLPPGDDEMLSIHSVPLQDKVR